VRAGLAAFWGRVHGEKKKKGLPANEGGNGQPEEPLVRDVLEGVKEFGGSGDVTSEKESTGHEKNKKEKGVDDRDKNTPFAHGLSERGGRVDHIK
jgi:hypothetical protein